MNLQLKTAIKHWQYVAPVCTFPKNDRELAKLQTELDALLDIVGNDENHKLIELVDLISNLIESYESKHLKYKMGHGVNALKYLMAEQAILQKDLPEIGSQGVVSSILNGKRQLNLRQIKQLAERFNVDPATFMDDE